MTETKEIEFSKLRLAYVTVKKFIETETWENVKSIKDRIAADLGIFGDDNYELLSKFVDKFELEHSEFNYSEHFHSEDELFDSETAFYRLLAVLIWLPIRSIELLTLNSIKIPKLNLSKPTREVKDLTFRDLLIWYIEGKFIDQKKIEYRVATAR